MGDGSVRCRYRCCGGGGQVRQWELRRGGGREMAPPPRSSCLSIGQRSAVAMLVARTAADHGSAQHNLHSDFQATLSVDCDGRVMK